MLQRWLVAIVGLPLLLAVLLLCPPWATMLLVCAIAGAAAYELLRVAGKDASKQVCALTVLFAAAQVLGFYKCDGTDPMQVLFRGPLPLVVCLFFAAVMTFGKPNAVSFATVSAGIVGGAVFPMMYACIVLLRVMEPYGRVYVLAPFFVAFAGDTLSMYFGMLWGKKKMAPLVSPKKTWAGFWGGPVGSALGMLLLGFIGARWLGYPANYPLLALAGVVGNLFGQLGDLSMSLVKREAGVKDYSHLFLTHGGMLDRFDSTLFIAPVIYLFVSVGMI
jgi:phosphatidate cytidylyltransferase